MARLLCAGIDGFGELTAPIQEGLATAKDRPPARRSTSGLALDRAGLCILVAGATISGLLAVATAAQGGDATVSTAEAELGGLATPEIELAAPSLVPTSAAALIAGAKACTAPLATVTVFLPGAASKPEMVRVRSGAYLSPPFLLSMEPHRVAIPYPAPYASGRGELGLVGEAGEVTLALTPPRRIQALSGVRLIPVRWTPKPRC